MAYRVVGVIVEKVPPKAGCGTLLVLGVIVFFVLKSGSSSSNNAYSYVPPPPPANVDNTPEPLPPGPVPPPERFAPPQQPRPQGGSFGAAPTAAAHDRSALGIGIVDIGQLDAAKRAKLHLGDDSGVLVTTVAPGGAAQAAGMQAGDVILAFNGTPVPRTTDLQALAGSAGIGAAATVRVRRTGRILNLAATLQAAEQAAAVPLDFPSPSPRSATNDGTDAALAVLAPGDDAFVDTRGGWGWGDKCWLNIKAGKLGWAKAECLQGMALGPASPNPKASLLYNLGVIEKKSGNPSAARQYFEQSLALREHPEVRAALESLR